MAAWTAGAQLRGHCRSLLWLAIAALLIGASPAEPGEVRIFDDWAVGCDNQRHCRAVSLASGDPIDGPVEDPIAIAVSRGGAGADRASLSVAWPDADGPYRLSLDGETIVTSARDGSGLDLADDPHGPNAGPAARLLARLHQGRWLSLHNAHGDIVRRSSLRGLEAAMLYMDRVQQRLGTRTALAVPGRLSPDRIKPPPRHWITVPRRSALPPTALPADLQARVAREQQCEAGADDLSANAPVHTRLDARTTLALVPWPCANGPYNVWSEAFLIDNAGVARPARFESHRNADRMAGSSIVNPDWDGHSAQLSSFSRGRSWGDCGTRTRYVWDGAMFRIVERETMPVCRRSEDFIVIWQATPRSAARR